MNVQEALTRLKAIDAQGDSEGVLMVYIQTGPDSWEWRKVTSFAVSIYTSKHTAKVVEVAYE